MVFDGQVGFTAFVGIEVSEGSGMNEFFGRGLMRFLISGICLGTRGCRQFLKSFFCWVFSMAPGF